MTDASAEATSFDSPPPPSLPGPTPRSWWLAPLLLALFTIAVRLVYLFAFSGYEDNLYSDMEGYWRRAHAHLLGGVMESEQWMAQAPLFHVIISMVLRAIRAHFTLWDHRLEVYLVLQTLLGGLSTYFLYFLTQNLFSSRRLSAIVSGLYALSFPLIYLSGFVVTENIAIPLLIASAFYCTRRSRTPLIISAILIGLLSYTLLLPLQIVVAATAAACLFHWLAGEDDSVVTGAICLAIAIGIRPATLPLAGPMLLFVFFRFSRTPNWRTAALFLFGLVLATGLVSYYNNVVSSGRVTGLGAGGGISFFFAQCEYDRMIFEYDGSRYWILQPGSETKTTLRTVRDKNPPFEQAHFYEGGLQCLKRNPNPLEFNLRRLQRLYRGSFFPAADRPSWELQLISIFYIPFWISLSLVLLLSAPIVFIRGNLYEDRHYYLMWALFTALVVTHAIFLAEQRYLLPAIFPIYLGSVSVLLRCFPGLRSILGVAEVENRLADSDRSSPRNQ